MGFLEKLQDIGFGNRGPYGRMESGAQYLGRQIDKSVYNTKDRGLTQEIAAAAKDGQVSFQTQVDLSEKWGVSLREVMARVRPVNAEANLTRKKNVMRSMEQQLKSFKKNNPNEKPTDKQVEKMMIESDAQLDDYELVSKGLSAMFKRDKLVVPKTSGLYEESLAGKLVEVVPPETGKTPKEIEVEAYARQTGKNLADKATGKPPKLEGQDLIDARLQASKKLAAYKKRIADQPGSLTDNTVYDILMNFWLASDQETFKFEELTAEYERHRKEGQSRNDAVNSVLNEKREKVVTREIAQKYLDENGNDIDKAREAARADGYTF